MDSTQTLISLGHAFRHCASTGSYWGWIIASLLFPIIAFILVTRYEKKSGNEVTPLAKIILAFAALAFIACTILIRPCTVAQNTSEAAAARGNYIGY